MAHLNKNLTDDPQVPKETVVPQIVIGSTPVFVAGVLRRANTGNFEHIDVSATMAIPIPDGVQALDVGDIEMLRQLAADAASEAFTIAAGECSKRYNDIRAMRSTNSRQPNETD